MRVKRHTLLVRAAAALSLGSGIALLFYACTDSRTPCGGSGLTCTNHTTSTAGSGGDVGGSGGAAGGGGTAAGGMGGLGGGGGGGILPADEPCLIDGAFGTTGMAFLSPTPADLAAALSKLTFAYQGSPRALSVVLLASQGPPNTSVGLGATEDNGSGLQAFLAGKAPTLVNALMAHGWFETSGPQDVAWLRVVDDNGPVDIELDNVTLDAKTADQCGSIWATIDAVVPNSQAPTLLTIDGVAATIGDLAAGSGGSGGGPAVDWPMRAVFQAEAVSFDFDSLL